MVDGYEYLQGLSTQLPDMFRETAAAHRKTLQDAIHLLSPEEQAEIAERDKVTEDLHIQSMQFCIKLIDPLLCVLGLSTSSW